MPLTNFTIPSVPILAAHFFTVTFCPASEWASFLDNKEWPWSQNQKSSGFLLVLWAAHWDELLWKTTQLSCSSCVNFKAWLVQWLEAGTMCSIVIFWAHRGLLVLREGQVSVFNDRHLPQINQYVKYLHPQNLPKT